MKKLDKLNKILDLVDQDYPTHEDVGDAIRLVAQGLSSDTKKVDARVTAEITKADVRIRQLGQRLANDISAVEEDVQKTKKRIDTIKLRKGDKGEKGDTGEDADPKVVARLLKEDEAFQKKLRGKNGSADRAEDIRNKLERLIGDERLDKSAIKGFEELERLVQVNGTRGIVGSGNGFNLYADGSKVGMIKTLDFAAGSNMTIMHSKVNGRDTLTFASTGGSGGSGEVVQKEVTQTAHGFVVKQPVYISGGVYVAAINTSATTAEAVGVVTEVVDVNTFVLTTHGYVDTLSGMTQDTVYYVPPSAGAFTDTPPTASDINSVDKPIFVALSSTAGYVINYRGLKITAQTDVEELARDAVGAMATDTATIDFTYNDGANTLTADIKAASVTEAMQVLADNATNNASTSAHGYLKKLSNVSTEYMDGTGNWSTPAGGSSLVGCMVYQNAGTTCDTSWVSLVFNVEDFDTDTMHDNSTNPTRITFTTAGKYIVGGNCYFSGNLNAGVRVRLNGTTVIATSVHGNVNPTSSSCSVAYTFAASDYIEIQGYASSSTSSSGDVQTNGWAIKVG